MRFHFADENYDIDLCQLHLSEYVTFMKPMLENARRAEVFNHEKKPRLKGRAPRVDGRVQVQPWVDRFGNVVYSDRRDTSTKCLLCGRLFDAYNGVARHLLSKHSEQERADMGWTTGMTYNDYVARWGEQLGEMQQASISLKGLVKS
jgi:hypothetical protein